ncbi:hypothetical protein FQN50_005100 [Emmonsiellopsis sp. PD_5]|nr:hypothetical protein FQN50_005100 [Emmonsiellopsis sp. PD_5]
MQGCKDTFASEKLMKRHKLDAIDHEYCRRCDMDFADEVEFLYHKIKSSKHIACPICGIEFKSQGGQDIHFRQFHRADQQITCQFCNEKFSRAAAFVLHFENDQCALGLDKYKEIRVKKQATIAFMDRALSRNGNSFAMAAPSALDSEDGGVGVSLLDLIDDDEDVPMSKARSGTDAITAKLSSMDIWPALGSKEDEATVAGELDLLDLEMSPKPKQAAPVNTAGSVSGVSVPGSASASAWNDSVMLPPTKMVVPNNNDNDEQEKKQWDPEKFFNSLLGEYNCVCNESFQTQKEFESHLLSGVHSGGIFRCPGCLRLFKTNTALIAHCESASVRCKVSLNPRYAEIMDEISGGLLETSGVCEDGSIRYRASKKTDVTTPKIDLNKVKW